MKDVREALAGAEQRLGEHGQGTMLFIDEVHRFSKSQQDVLLPAVEDGLVVLIGATTENPFFEVNPPLLSRTSLWRLHALSPDDLRRLVLRGLELEEAEAEPDAVDAVVAACEGDARAALTTVEVAVALARAAREGGRGGEAGTSAPSAGSAASGKSARESGGGSEAPIVLTMDDMARARDGRLFHQGADEHYDQISALIKSVRGSDADAGLYWMARMIEGGEDPRFLARRMVILASEDIGLADPQALLVAEAAARAVEYVGLPEAALNLAEAVIYLARAPKSNAVVRALGLAQADVRSGVAQEVPAHLRDAHYKGAASLGHGEGYVFPHDDPSGVVEQQYRPEALQGRVYYEPTSHGAEGGRRGRGKSRQGGRFVMGGHRGGGLWSVALGVGVVFASVAGIGIAAGVGATAGAGASTPAPGPRVSLPQAVPHIPADATNSARLRRARCSRSTWRWPGRTRPRWPRRSPPSRRQDHPTIATTSRRPSSRRRTDRCRPRWTR